MPTLRPARTVAGMYPVLLFDGDCTFCTARGNVLTRRIRPRVQIIARQRADLCALGVRGQECQACQGRQACQACQECQACQACRACQEGRECQQGQESIRWFAGPELAPVAQGRAVAAAPAPLTGAGTTTESAHSGAAAWSGAPASASLAA